MSQTSNYRMTTVIRRINRIFRRASREMDSEDALNNDDDEHTANGVPIHRTEQESESESNSEIIKLQSTGFHRKNDGSVTLSMRLDKDQVECCVCLSSMTDKIYRCRGSRKSAANNEESKSKKVICHNVCGSCQWNIRRMKASNGHTKQMQCPICKVRGTFVRNHALERKLTELSTECLHNKHGCGQRFFPWDGETKYLHEKHLCVYQPVDCPFCHQTIKGGRVNFVEHLVKSAKKRNDDEVMDDDEGNEDLMMENKDVSEEKEAPNNRVESDGDDQEKEEINDAVPGCAFPFYQSKTVLDLLQKERNIIAKRRDGNEFIVNYNLGIVTCFISPTKDCDCWKVYCLSISPTHGIGGNSRIYLQYLDYDKRNDFVEKQQSLGLITTKCLSRPITNTLILPLNRLHPTSLQKMFNSYDIDCSQADNNKKLEMQEMKDNEMELDLDDLEQYQPSEFLAESPCTKIECGYIYGGNLDNLYIRTFSLEESFKVGAVIDARDFTGKWYEAEIIAVQDCEGNVYENLDKDNDDYLEIRRAKIHYLGYSQNYDEWLFVDTDSHRIAQRGTFTIGPDLRAIRRNTTHNAHVHQHPHPQHPQHHLRNPHNNIIQNQIQNQNQNVNLMDLIHHN